MGKWVLLASGGPTAQQRHDSCLRKNTLDLSIQGFSFSRCSSIKLSLLEVPATCGDTISIVHFGIKMILESIDLII